MDDLKHLSKKKNLFKDNHINILFYRIWRNIIIRNEILLHVRLYNMHKLPILVGDVVNELSNYRFLNYLKSLHIDSNNELATNKLPYGLEYLSFSEKYNHIIVKGMIPDTVRTIEFSYYSIFNQTLDGNWLPPSLTSLKFGRSFQQPIKVGHLPNSLTNLQLYNYYEGTIEQGAIPNSLTSKDKSGQFGYCKFNSNNNDHKINKYSIPKSTTKLVFDNEFNQPLKIGDVPHNVTSLKMNPLFNKDIEPFALPQSITDLSLKNYAFIERNEYILPPNLTSLTINRFNFEPTERILAKSLTTLVVGSINQQIDAVSLLPNLTTLDINSLEIPFQLAAGLFPKSLTSVKIEESEDIPMGFFINHTKLKKMVTTTHRIPASTLPNSITELHLMLRKSLYKNPLINLGPLTSLTNLKLIGWFNKSTNFSHLPPTITSLTLGWYFNKPIINDELPNNIKVLYILNPSFNKNIPTDDNQLPKSLETIIISPENYKLLNSLNLNFILKYIKFNTLYEDANY